MKSHEKGRCRLHVPTDLSTLRSSSIFLDLTGEWSAGRSLEQDEKEVEETTFEDEHGKYFWSMRGDFADRHRDEQSPLR